MPGPTFPSPVREIGAHFNDKATGAGPLSSFRGVTIRADLACEVGALPTREGSRRERQHALDSEVRRKPSFVDQTD
jgi:hypothetical protein